MQWVMSIPVGAGSGRFTSRAVALRCGMPDELDPPRKFYGLKPREFEVVNAQPRHPGESPPAAGAASEPRPEAIDVNDLIRSANAGGAGLLPKAGSVAENEVHAILRDNLARAEAAGLNELTPKPRRKSRRKRDYWLLLAGACAVFGTIILKSGPREPVTFIVALGGLVVSTVGLTWILWFVMDDY